MVGFTACQPSFSHIIPKSIKQLFSARSPREIVAKLLAGDIVISEFELKLRYYVHFRTNTLIPTIYWLNTPSTVFL